MAMIILLLTSLAIGSASGQEDAAIIAPIKPLPPVNMCDTVKCPAGTKCVLHQIVCVTTPCDPIPTCEPIGDSKCPGKNQVWSDCGSACPKKCEQEEPVMCPAVCRPGCVCKKGFCLNKLGQCVADKNCGILTK
ncbi:Protein CBG20706 [Caenorhabditis briggsae]|uniref:Protein CBG20706 n=2 Tax=Caenorhabditis briggsae TaxID=6238 RepID=A8XYF4_CAEBR|nr:Protein CBG20706 [Caenorhabditis briggsae]ULT92600.1 hypothetical protein L3Y34_010002 [Caenorhabditis briggsae]CAP37671.1 Protein CBG20706 [Caenorhabditis briggsae]